jgi:predicted deacylase
VSEGYLLKKILIDGARPGPHLLVTGGVHGDEFEPMAAVRRLAEMIDAAQLAGALTLVPVVNEAAFRRGQRVAEDGLDLARTCPGCANGSITEQIAFELSEAIRGADFYIDMHTGGLVMQLHALAGYMLHADAAVLQQQQAMARAFDFPVVWGTDPALNGRSLSVARDAGVPAIYVECGGAPICDRQSVHALTEGCLNVMGQLAMIDRPSPQQGVHWWIEDQSSGSGHLQACHPAPCDGFFEPAVVLGAKIGRSQPLGWIVDTLGTERTEVSAETSGLVVGLRSLPAVAQGDALGVVLATDNPVMKSG